MKHTQLIVDEADRKRDNYNMQYRPIDDKDFERGMNIGYYSGLSAYNRALDMFQLYPDLFVGCYNDDQLIGICYGWPEYIHRNATLEMELVIISMAPEFRRKGLGTPLIHTWEDQVRKRGNWLVGLGTGVPAFYLNAGYTPVEYYFRIHKCQIPECDKATVDKAYYISRSSDPTFSLYFKTNGNYQSDVFNDLRSKLNGIHGIQDAGITFRKQL